MPSFGWEEGMFKYKEERDQDAELDTLEMRRAHAILGYKVVLLNWGTNRKINEDVPTYGDAMRNAVKDFQATQVGLIPDGVLGPRTAYRLCWCHDGSIVKQVELDYGIPNGYVGRIGALEANYYLAALNHTSLGDDRGSFQWHDSPDPIRDYMDLENGAERTAVRLQSKHLAMLKIDPASPKRNWWTHRWWAAIFAHNAPAWAPIWLEAGCPEIGGETVTVGDWEGPMFEWATLYKNAVLSRTCDG